MRKITTSEMMHIYGGFGAGVDYAVRISVRLTDPVDADILRRALDRTQPRYPYLCGHLQGSGPSYGEACTCCEYDGSIVVLSASRRSSNHQD
jgi:hypothetical protein